MDKQAIKHLLYGGIKELMNDRTYYYDSSVDKKYSHFTKSGEAAVQQFVTEIATFITAAEAVELDHRAKDMVLKELKGN